MIEKMKVMVVDDNTVNLATVEQDLKDKYDVVPMISGRRAVKYLYRDRVDLILLDVQMPIMDGIETLREIRTQPNGTTVPVIFLTSRTDKNTVIEGSKLGIMDYITKPFESEDLLNRIERVFKRLGKLPMEEEELLFRMREILQDIQEGKNKAAIFKMDEVLGYQIDVEISGRIKNARMKMEEGMQEGAINMMDRVVRLLESKNQSGAKAQALPISTGEINARLLYILDDLTNFKLKDSINKVIELQKYELPDYVAGDLNLVKQKLEDYDDEEAEKMVKNILEKMKKPNTINLGGKKDDVSYDQQSEKNGSGYHYNRLL